MPRQGLLLRRPGNDQNSYFKQLLKCRAEDDPVFSEWLNRKNQNFTSPEIQNKILKRNESINISIYHQLSLSFIVL